MRDLRQDELNHISGGGGHHGKHRDHDHKASRTDKKNESHKHAHKDSNKHVKHA
jgi:hypothetical protein